MDIYEIAGKLQAQYTQGIEHCGFIVNGEIIEAENVAVDPTNHFEIKDCEVDKYLDQAQATWHSHTHDNPNLSLDDFLLFSQIRECYHFIVAQGRTWVYYTDIDGTIVVGARIDETNND